MRELHSNGAIRLHHMDYKYKPQSENDNMDEKEYIEEYKEEYTGTVKSINA